MKIWIKDHTFIGSYPWTVEYETDNSYCVFHKYAVSHIDKSKVYRDDDGRFRYKGYVYMPDNPEIPAKF